MVKVLRRLVGGVWRLVRSLYLDPLKEALIDLRGLSLNMKILAVAGYVVVLGLLLLTLLLERFGHRLPAVTFTVTRQGRPVQQQIPILVMWACSLSLVLGWAYLLAGATDCRRWFFLPVMGLFTLQLLFVMPFGSSDVEPGLLESLLVLPFCCSAPLLILGVTGAFLLTGRRALWHRYPLVEVAFWGFVLAAYLLGQWVLVPTKGTIAMSLDAMSSLLSLLAVPWWLFSGLTLIHAALELGRTLAVTLRGLLPSRLLRTLALFVLLAHPSLLLFGVAIARHPTLPSQVSDMMILDGLLAPVLILAMLVMVIIGRWNVRNAATLLTLSFALPVFSAGVMLSLGGIDFTDVMGLTLESVSGDTSMLVFVGLMAYSVLSLGATFANGDSEAFPQGGRILLGFGVSLLVIAFTLFFVNVRDLTGAPVQDFQEVVPALFGLGVFFLGLPYLGWTIWKRRDTLAGDEEEFQDVIPMLTAIEVSRTWAVVLTIAAVLGACLICLLGALLVEPPF
jgi:hypothetical protein